MRSLDFSITTVALKQHRQFVLRNALTFKKLNFKNWLVSTNDTYLKLKLPLIDSRYKVRDLITPKIKNPSLFPNLQHTNSLLSLLKELKSEFVLILDPDFIVFDALLVERMFKDFTKSNLKIFGTPYFPTWYMKKMNAIAIYFAFSRVNTSIEIGTNSNFEGENLDSKNIKIIYHPIFRYFYLKLKTNRFFKFTYDFIFRRRFINRYQDTFYETEKYYSRKEGGHLRIEISHKQLSEIAWHLKFKIGQVIEDYIPRRLSYLPNSYNVNESINQSDFLNVEHYSYKETLVGGHFRLYPRGKFHKKNSIITESELSKYLGEIKK